MTATNYLEQIVKTERLIKNKLIEIEKWRTIAEGTSANVMGERVQTSVAYHKMEDAIIKMHEVEEKTAQELAHYKEMMREMIATIEKLDTQSYDLLHKMYVQGRQLKDIKQTYGISWKSIERRKEKALKDLQGILDEREKEISS
ncbi:MAG: hypothetical protein KBT27_13080 [Prevotellaceae bacterium]|nr:hypothetical protein [Candidatus Faecinaster equi]